MSKLNVYRVSEVAADGEWLVRAKTRAGAVAHVARNILCVELATADQVLRMAKDGAVIEVAGEKETNDGN